MRSRAGSSSPRSAGLRNRQATTRWAARRAQWRRSQTDFGGIKASVDGANANDPDAFVATLTQVESRLSAVDPPNLLGDLAAAPRLQRAAERAAQCQQLTALAANAPR